MIEDRNRLEKDAARRIHLSIGWALAAGSAVAALITHSWLIVAIALVCAIRDAATASSLYRQLDERAND